MGRKSTTCASASRFGFALVPFGFLAGVLLTAIPAAGDTTTGDDPPEAVTRVEEDWQLVLNEPDSLVEAPQFHTVMSPSGDLEGLYALVIWNYREIPYFLSGGLQLQSWNGDAVSKRRTIGDALLSTTAETITWTQALDTNGIRLRFDLTNGHSVTWGDFAWNITLQEYAFLPDLSGYQTSQSVENSCITYGANRVDRLVITEVRRYGESGLISTDSVPKVVYERLDPLSDGDDPDPIPED
jgi:hypothetical protein